MKRLFILVLSGLVMGIAPHAHASLIDRGMGLIYDSDLGITWYDASSAGLLMTESNYDANGAPQSHPLSQYLTNLSVAGITGWRLPTTPAIDLSRLGDPYASSGELGHLFYTELHGVQRLGLINGQAPFTGLQAFPYWTGTVADDTGGMTSFYILDLDTGKWDIDCGMQGMSDGNYLLAVKDGDVGATAPPVPVPAAVWLLGSGLLGLLGVRRRQGMQ